MEISTENNMNITNVATENDSNINVDTAVLNKSSLDVKDCEMESELDNPGDTEKDKLIRESKSRSVYEEKSDIAIDIEHKLTEVDTNHLYFRDSEINKETNDSDAESQENHVDSPIKKSRSRLQPLIDSDSSEDESENIRELIEDPKTAERNGRQIKDSPDKLDSDYAIMKSRLKALCDSESSEDEPSIHNFEISTEKEECHSKIKSIKAKKIDKTREKNMTAKEYENQKLEIKSESQRMQREQNVSLPYHRPKTRSLKEFLEKRPRFTAALANKGGKTPPILAIKMTNQNLENISKKMEEREKILEDFYKSESESEEEEMKDTKTNDKITADSQIKPLNISDNKEIIEITADSEKIHIIDEEINKNSDNKNPDIVNTIKIISNIIIPANSEEISTNNESAEYEFSLDNAELSENISDSINQIEELKDAIVENKQNSDDSLLNQVDCGSDLEPKKKLNRLQLLKEALGNSTPKLSGDPNEIINFDDDVTIERNKGCSGVDRLIQRFIKHSTRTIKPKDDSVQVDILTLSGGELHTEVLTMQVHDDSADEPVAFIETPGAKLKKLRSTLQSQMSQRRSELWKQKNVLENVPSTDNEVRGKDGYEEGEDYDILDDEEEEFDVEEEEDEDAELLEDDVDMTEKKRGKKSAFVEEEAVLSEAEDATQNDNDSEESSEDDDDSDEVNDIEQKEPTTIEDITNETQTLNKKKMKRIISMDDSDDDDDESNISNVVIAKDKPVCKGPLDSTDPWEDEDDDSLLYPNAQRPPSRQRTPQLTRTKSSMALGFITPVRHLTALQSFDSSLNDEQDKQQEQETKTGPFGLLPLPPDPSPLRGNAWQRHLLFPECDAANMASSTVNMEELANEICSGEFPSTICSETATYKNDQSNFIKPSFNNVNSTQQSQPSTQDVLDICSGNFTCTTQTNSSNNEDSNESNAMCVEKSESSSKIINSLEAESLINKKIQTLEALDDDDDKIISQLLDEEEMENFKKKFESPVNLVEKNDIPPRSPICSRITFDTTDEDDEDDEKTRQNLKLLRKKRKKKCLIEDSGDEEENEDFGNEDDRLEDDETRDSVENIGSVVDYDSEENEVDILAAKPALRLNDFVENEAELSESDWGSADEDEKDLDELDVELGDADKFDEQKLRTGIERVQLRQMLDEDNKDLKMLQEMLLEDGELHGTGRERQFKWKNIDNTFDLEGGEKNENDEEYLDETAADSEEIWRKKRHERVLFLQSRKISQEIENDDIILSSTSILKLGQKAIVRNASTSQNATTVTEEEEKVLQKQISLTVKQPFTLLNKRGSFLSRGEKVLAKVAEFTKSNERVSGKGPTKFSRNFLFSTVLSETDLDNTKKRKADDGTPTAIKKLRLNNLSPALNRSSGKNSAKKLFSNI